MRFLELPLLKRELLELAQRRRTYALRCLVLFVFALVFLLCYVEMTNSAQNLMQVLGQGNEITAFLFVTLMMVIYALNPALACTAITAEKEKQTLGLLIISKLTPGGIVLEKLASRMVPLFTLLLVSVPLFAMAYLFGGVTLSDSMMGLFIVFLTMLQVTAVAVFFSALLESGIAAFWCTYIALAVIYFTLPILHEMGLFSLDIVGLPGEEFLLFPIYQMAMLVDFRRGHDGLLTLMLPTIGITLGFLVAARFAVVRFSYGAAFSFVRQIKKTKATAVRLIQKQMGASEKAIEAAATQREERPQRQSIWSHLLSTSQPIAWREMRGTILGSRKLQIAIIIGLFLFELSLLVIYSHDEEEISACMSLGGLIFAVLLVMGLSCRLFATERERQTLDSLLTTPLTNRQLLGQKLAGINRLILVLLITFALFGVLNLLTTNVYTYMPGLQPGSSNWYANRVRVSPFSPFDPFFPKLAIRFLICAVGNAFIYLHLVKWIAVFFGMKLNTQMKAMLTSILVVLALCIIPTLIMVLAMVATDNTPTDIPLFCFVSPAIIPAFNEVHEMHNVYRGSWFPDSDAVVVITNFLIYGGLTLLLRMLVCRNLSGLLNRRESEPGS
ncbi:MAG: hypothetical protein ABGZ24_30870 [Fuerstiella sp.]